MSPKAERNNYSRVKSNNKTQTRKANETSSNTKVALKLQDLKKPVYNKVLKKRWFSTPNKRDLTSLLDKGNNLDITTTWKELGDETTNYSLSDKQLIKLLLIHNCEKLEIIYNEKEEQTTISFNKLSITFTEKSLIDFNEIEIKRSNQSEDNIFTETSYLGYLHNNCKRFNDKINQKKPLYELQKAIENWKEAKKTSQFSEMPRLMNKIVNLTKDPKNIKKQVWLLENLDLDPILKEHYKNKLDSNDHFKLGCHYHKINLQKALEWYEKAAEQNHQKAQLCLGNMYTKKGMYQNAVNWYKKAALNGSEKAVLKIQALAKTDNISAIKAMIELSKEKEQWVIKLITLGKLEGDEKITEEDSSQALKRALRDYFKDHDNTKAKKWAKLTAKQDDEDKVIYVKLIMEEFLQSGPEEKETMQEITTNLEAACKNGNIEAYKILEDLYKKHTKYPEIRTSLGNIFLEVDFEPYDGSFKCTKKPNIEKALEYLGDNIDTREVQFKLGRIYESQDHLDLTKAGECYKKAYECDHKEALNGLLRIGNNNSSLQNMIGEVFLKNENFDKAEKWLLKSAKANNNHAMYNLGTLYKENNPDKAIQYFNNAYQAGNNAAIEKLIELAKTNTEAQFIVGIIYIKKQEMENAKKFLKLASDSNHYLAKINFNHLEFCEQNNEEKIKGKEESLITLNEEFKQANERTIEARDRFFNAKNSYEATDTLIVGMGPGGLARALRELKNGKKVTLVEKRSEDTFDLRPGLMNLDKATSRIILSILEEYFKDNTHVFSHKEKVDQNHRKSVDQLKSLLRSNSQKIMPTKVIQRILYQALQKEADSKGKKLLTIAFDANIKDIQGESRVMLLEEQRKIGFTDIVFADGTGIFKDIADDKTNKPEYKPCPSELLNLSIGRIEIVEKSESHIPTSTPWQLAVWLKLPEGISSKLTSDQYLRLFKEADHIAYFTPDGSKVWFTGVVTEDIHKCENKEEKKEMIKRYVLKKLFEHREFQNKVKLQYSDELIPQTKISEEQYKPEQVDEDQRTRKKFQAKEPATWEQATEKHPMLKLSEPKIELGYLNTPGVIERIGDTYRMANFYLAEGSNRAIQTGYQDISGL